MLEYQSIKTFSAKSYVSNWSEEVFVVKKVKNTVPWTYVISDLKGKKTVGKFYKKIHKKKTIKDQDRKKLYVKLYDKLYVKWKRYGILLTVRLIKKTKYQ